MHQSVEPLDIRAALSRTVAACASESCAEQLGTTSHAIRFYDGEGSCLLRRVATISTATTARPMRSGCAC